jgi:predicted phosphodiesterase
MNTKIAPLVEKRPKSRQKMNRVGGSNDEDDWVDEDDDETVAKGNGIKLLSIHDGTTGKPATETNGMEQDALEDEEANDIDEVL